MIRFPFGIDPVAIWEGDNRTWHTPLDFNNPVPLSSRVWWRVRFNTDDLSTLITEQDTGATWVTYAGIPTGNYTTTGKAPVPNPATVECTDSGIIIVDIEDDAKNPLSIVAPPIEINYRISFLPSSGIVVRKDIDRFPWHELHIAVDGTSVVQMQQAPLGPTFTPADLAMSTIGDIVEFYGAIPSLGSCNAGNEASLLPKNLNLDCVFL